MENEFGQTDFVIKEENILHQSYTSDRTNCPALLDDDRNDIKVKLELIVTEEVDIKHETDETLIEGEVYELEQERETFNTVVYAKERQFECKCKDKSCIKLQKKSSECETCGKKFTHGSNLRVHMRIHTGERPFKCEICRAKFTGNNSLQVHMRIHTGEKPFKCKICGKKFTDTSNLRVHMRIHSGEKPFECKVCGNTFTDSTNLRVHIKIHSGEKPFQCEICRNKFTRNSSLKIHMRMHTGEKPS